MTVPEPLPTTLDPETLRERVVDEPAARARVDELRAALRDPADTTDELLARGDLVDLLRQLDELDLALTDARTAVDRAETVGTAAQVHLARLRLAHVQAARGDFADATLVVTELLGVADQFGPVIDAATHELAGTNAYLQGHGGDAVEHFERALELRGRLELPEAERSRIALAAARRLAEGSSG